MRPGRNAVRRQSNQNISHHEKEQENSGREQIPFRWVDSSDASVQNGSCPPYASCRFRRGMQQTWNPRRYRRPLQRRIGHLQEIAAPAGGAGK